ncbi:MAG TPA: T9SS type A sorting domain-containing protein [Saprospiraceae bacterium]|nr:T9SS type A sorting domain-containing protein [Saprospiraceae bacterium]
MNISNKSAFTVLFVLFCFLSFGRNSANVPNQKDGVFSCLSCNEPAPANFAIVEATPFTLKATWDAPANYPAEYNVKVYVFLSDLLIQDFNIPGTATEVTAQSLTPNTKYKIIVTPVCNGGTYSPNSSADDATTTIIELVVSGFSVPSNPVINCTIENSMGDCELDPPGTYVVPFRIYRTANPSIYHDFAAFKVSNDCQNYIVKYQPNVPSGSLFTFTKVGNANVSIKFNGNEVALVGFFNSFTTEPDILVALQLTSGNNGYKIERRTEPEGIPDANPGGSCPGSNRSAQEITLVPSITASPNPFSQMLNIQVPFATSIQETEITLFDLQGRQILKQSWPAGQMNIIVSTNDLIPGMYFLRAQSGGISETVKVVRIP